MHCLTPFRVLAALLLFSLLSVRADEIDNYVREQMARQHIPGLALAVVTNGTLAKVNAYGLANVELNVPAKPDTIFQIQSITKTFTASAVMLLVEEGKISLDDKITKYLSNLPELWTNITVRHLLTHTSGIKDYINEPTVNMRLDLSPMEVIDSLRKLPLNFQPGEQYSYCNTGYHILGMIIKKVTGKFWDDFVHERILEPLQMNETKVVNWSDIITNRAAGYGLNGGKLVNGNFIAPTIVGYAGGGLRSTVLDLAKWDAALYTEKILKKSTLEQMWTPAKLNDGSLDNYGFGWGITNHNGHKLVNHTGSHMTGFRTALMRYVDDKVTVIVFTNQREAFQSAIGRGVASYYIPGLRSKSRESD
jgi:CubicO group peptidase (beta-lactamase class C family)